ncbi:DUF2795 domain-containing protein [Streptomyces sparsus]
MADTDPIELQKALKNADYPASRADLASLARDNGADSGLVEKIESLPDTEYDGPDAVTREVFHSR